LFGSPDGVASAVGAEFAVDDALVGFHGVDRQVQLSGDLGVALIGGPESEPSAMGEVAQHDGRSG
jgi:hypothetical protein